MTLVHRHVEEIRNILRESSARISLTNQLIDDELQRFRLGCRYPRLSRKTPSSPIVSKTFTKVDGHRRSHWQRIVEMKSRLLRSNSRASRETQASANELPKLLVSGYEKASKLTQCIQTTIYEVTQELARCTFYALDSIDLQQPNGLDMASQLWGQLMKSSTKLRFHLRTKANILDHRRGHLLLFIERGIRNPFALKSDSEHLELLESAISTLYEIFDSLKRLKVIVIQKRNSDENEKRKVEGNSEERPVTVSTSKLINV